MKLAESALAAACLGLAAALGTSPVSRVVQLLEGLQAKLTADAKAEQELFERYQCWYKDVVESKAASNSAAQSRVDSLSAYIKDIDAGRIEFTTERTDLELQIKNLKHDVETAKALRDQEHEDYLAAKEEMETAIAALGQAIDAIQSGTSLAQTAGPPQQRLLNLKWSLRKVLQFGRAILSTRDARLLEAALDGDVPSKDWKKLNRKATFKMKYGANSGKILEILKDMEQTFKDNLDAAKSKEDATEKAYASLMAAKESMLASSEDALVALVEETGARSLSKQDAQDEVDSLKAQIEADTKFAADVEAAYKEKSGEFDERKSLRMAEIAAISKAISVLHSDDARDLFKRSTASQGYFFLQRRAGTARGHRQATQRLWALAAARRDPMLSLVARAAARAGGRFDEVTGMIDKLVTQLEDEGATDLKKKELCESEMAENTREAQTISRDMDTLSDEISKAEASVTEFQAQIKEEEEAIAATQGQITEIDRQRESEHAEYTKSHADDQKAIELIEEAMGILKAFYSENGLALVGVHRSTVHGKVLEPVEAGVAPPPPPATWETPGYGGATDEQSGIQSILTIVKTDIEKDLSKAKDAEEAAVAEHKAQKAELETAISDAEAAISGLNKQKADAEQTVEDKTTERLASKKNLDGVMSEIKAMKPGCDFFSVNFNIRVEKRNAEIDGLKKAKAILESA